MIKLIKSSEENSTLDSGYSSNPFFRYKPTFIKKDILDYLVKIINLMKMVKLF